MEGRGNIQGIRQVRGKERGIKLNMESRKLNIASGGLFAGGSLAAGLIAGGLFASGLNTAHQILNYVTMLRCVPFGRKIQKRTM